MSEKRFNFDDEYSFEIYDTRTEKHYDGSVGCQELLCDLLNELVENREKQHEKACKLFWEYQKLKEENKQLKERIANRFEGYITYEIHCNGDDI